MNKVKCIFMASFNLIATFFPVISLIISLIIANVIGIKFLTDPFMLLLLALNYSDTYLRVHFDTRYLVIWKFRQLLMFLGLIGASFTVMLIVFSIISPKSFAQDLNLSAIAFLYVAGLTYAVFVRLIIIVKKKSTKQLPLHPINLVCCYYLGVIISHLF
jgi:hypothetical protein